MGLTLHELYRSTKEKYQLTLVAGESGLNRIMSWVYISEDINTAEFLQCGELVITTGISASTNKGWLYEFISQMISHQTCGVILNTGRYLFPEDISTEILSLCNEQQFPLFLMPWEIHLHNITKDYYNRIFLETQSDHSISTAVLNVIHQTPDLQSSLHTLEDHGFPLSASYCITRLEAASLEFPKLPNERLLFHIESYLKEHRFTCHMVKSKASLLCIWNDTSHERIVSSMEALLHYLSRYDMVDCLTIGIGSMVASLEELSSSHMHAAAALTIARHEKKHLFDYEDMGFFKLLLSIEQPTLLTNYLMTYLGAVIDYDQTHNSNYTETLHQYLLCNGSIQAVASAMFCHRNTINYRVHTLKETLHYDLDNPNTRFHLMTAFLIQDYLSILG